MKLFKMLIMSLLVLSSLPASAASNSDIKAINKVVKQYFEGVRKGDEALLKRAFYNQNMNMKALLTIDGKEQLLSLADAEAFADLAKRPDASYTGKVLSINVYQPNAAFVLFDFNDMFIDGFQLLKQAGKWKILNKTFVEKK